MKILIHILSAVAVGLIIYNCTKIDFNNLFFGDSFFAIITILCAACALFCLQILRVSKEIEKYHNKD